MFLFQLTAMIHSNHWVSRIQILKALQLPWQQRPRPVTYRGCGICLWILHNR
jgi:hypothetical protein